MEKDVELLEANGWEVECLSPFEIRHEDGSFATLNAAKIVLEMLRADKPERRVVTMEHTCYGCPDVYEGVLDTGESFYIRCRHGYAVLKVGEDVMAEYDFGDGVTGVLSSDSDVMANLFKEANIIR